MAAANRSPGIGDARVPCPLCGGLIHPVAGRCKHCKEDLSSLRAGKPQAATPLPALNQAAPPPQQLQYGQVAATVVPGQTGINGHAAAVAAVTPPRADASQPILPPRPTSQWRMKAQRPRSLAKNWPLIVIILAVIAIVAAVVIMVWPQDDVHHGGKKRLMAPPAPDRMETDPLGKQSQVDPWGQPDDPGAQNTPTAPDDDDTTAQGGTIPRRTPDPPNAPPQNDPDDIFGGLGGQGGLSGGLGGTFMLTMLDKACHKLQTCPSSNQAMLAAACSSLSGMPKPPVPANCSSAQRCLDAIDQLDCDAGIDNPVSAISLIQDCTKAMTECT